MPKAKRTPASPGRRAPAAGTRARKKKTPPSPSGQPANAAVPAPVPAPHDGAGPLRIAGIGASAGGLEAMRTLVNALPADPGLGLVLIQHLDPNHQSLLSELLDRAGRLPVCEAVEGMRVEPNHLYVIPPGTNMTISAGTLRLAPRTLHRGQHMPIDIFLRSLAAELHHRAVGVILSGSSTDGAIGIEEIKGAGGITFAQDTGSAQFPNMPQAAMDSGCVDFVLPPAAIAHELARLGHHPYLRTSPEPKEAAAPAPAAAVSEGGASERESLHRVFLLLRNSVGVDFSQYKQATIKRRILRRMALLRMERMEDYARYLRNSESEMLSLYQDALIKVTSFFRDPPAFEFLKKKVLPRIFKQRPKNEPVRIWVPGCASGEEAYSLAILLMEHLGRRQRAWPVQIFATDLSEPALDRARDGIYIENIALDVSPERLERFFLRTGRHYQIKKAVREMVVFARQNVTKDPPFGRLDLISCRNLLIYLGPNFQRKIFPIFHYALKPGGFLLLGTAESVGEFSDLFAPAARKVRVFTRKNVAVLPRFDLPPSLAAPEFPRRVAPMDHSPDGFAPAPPGGEPPDVLREADRLLLQRYTPPGVVVTPDLEILQFRGESHAYFEPAPGKASFHLMKMIKEGLIVPLREVFARARRDNVPAKKRVTFSDHDAERELELEVVPLKAALQRDRYFLILFREILASDPAALPAPEDADAAGADGQKKPPPSPARAAADLRQLALVRQELAATREHLQRVIEEQDAINEEIKSANEEILSSNEELQSTNEELETAKEELQSANEELVTVNEELQIRNSELGHANNDLTNLINSVNFAIVMLGNDLRVRRFTAVAGRLLNLIPTDIGRPFTDIQSNLPGIDLAAAAEEVIQSVSSKELEVQDRAGRWYVLGIRPYKTADHKIDGAVLALVDIDALKRGIDEIRQSRDFSAAVVATVREPLVVLDDKLAVLSANTAFFETFHVQSPDTLGQSFFTLGKSQWNIPRLRKLLREVLEKGSRFQDFLVDHTFREIGHKKMLLNARRIYAEGDRPPLVLLAIEDITERRQIEQEILAISEREQRRMAQDLHDALGQQLAGVGLLVKALLGQFDARSQPEAAAAAEVILTQVNQATSLTRDLARGLNPMHLQRGDFQTAMQTLASSVESLFKISCNFHCEPPCPLPPGAEGPVNLYRIAQEAINNALKHGKAQRITLTLSRDSSSRRAALVIADDGTGIRRSTRDKGFHRGMGLQIMRYRAESFGGSLHVSHGPAGGTVVSVSFPGEPGAEIAEG